MDTKVTCVMIVDWEESLGDFLLPKIEALFQSYDLLPFEGTGNLDNKSSHGSYKRVKKRLALFLQNGHSSKNVHDIRILSEKKYEGNLPFCPSAMGVAWASGGRKDRQAIFFIRNEILENKENFIRDVEENICRHAGTFYGAVFELQAALGPPAYLASLIAIDFRSNQQPSTQYKERITRWRDNISGGIHPRSGFFREIYPINYVTESHLEKAFNGAPLKKFMEANGTLRRTNFNTQMYRWDIEEAKLKIARESLENSGLVLSSTVYPWN